jgi:hypothetical protein
VRGDEDEFDLRAHIESSGHQLELCPHVIVTRTAARGFLSKLGSRFHNWNKRWFVFDRESRTLSYYTDKNEKKSKARGGIPFEVRQILRTIFIGRIGVEMEEVVNTNEKISTMKHCLLKKNSNIYKYCK